MCFLILNTDQRIIENGFQLVFKRHHLHFSSLYVQKNDNFFFILLLQNIIEFILQIIGNIQFNVFSKNPTELKWHKSKQQLIPLKSILMQQTNTNKDRYSKLQKIGQGAYGSVYKALDKQSNDFVALKIINFDQKDEGISSTTLREISLLKTMNHENIVTLLDVDFQLSRTQGKAILVFQYMKQDLSKFIRREAQHLKKNPKRAKKIYQQILKGVQYLHQHRIIHRDLKPQNILIDQFGRVKIGDFGLGRIFNFPFRTMSKEIQTLWYRAPELLLGSQNYDLGVDVWSLGCILYELIECQGPLFRSQCEIQAIFKIFQYHGMPNFENWPQAKKLPYFKRTFPKFSGIKNLKKYKFIDECGRNLLNLMIQLRASNRISVSKALSHKFFADV